MLDITLVRDNPRLVKDSERKRNRNPQLVDQLLKLDEQWRKELKKVEELKHQRNIVSQEINQAKKAKKDEVAQKKIKQMQQVVKDIIQGEQKTANLVTERDQLLLQIGNILHPKVPPGKDDSQNVEIRKVGKKPVFSFPLKTHVELLEQVGLADFEASAKTSGHGFYYLKDELALLNQALIQFAISIMVKKGYHYIEPPLMIRKKVLEAAADTKAFADSIYTIEGEDLALIGTSEHALLGLHLEESIPEKQLPKKYCAYSMCFRKEVGAHGINEKGLWRTHQFNKIEQFIFCQPQDSEKYFEELLNNSEEILQALGLPYRVIEICSGDLGIWKHRSYDLEVWRPTTDSYGEVMSLSNCTDYQARKLGMKVVYADGTRKVLHTLNNTALATSRIMVALVEHHQTKKGTIKIPKALLPYMNGITELGIKK